ncbi:MAG: Mfa1 fimbrilin C-terminal domain-containing protein [Bacteroidales bacterium]|nr:Mfa1 fimbrilin C-terminal domain-containing protein [Bacteroidales bacterium]
MKKLSFLMAALLVAMTGCQKEPQVTPDGETNVAGKSYVSVNISLPNLPGTRANDNFNAGSIKEYQVNDINLVFFQDGAYMDHHELVVPVSWSSANETTNITTTHSTGAIEVNSPSINEVLVLINSKKIFPTANDLKKNFTTLNNTMETAIGNIADIDDPNFFMSNAPLRVGGNVQYLVPVVTSNDKDNTTPANVYVERASAKIEFIPGNSFTQPANGKVVFSKWELDITNKAFYPVRQVDDAWSTYPLYGGNSGIPANPDRIYYAKDHNYDSFITGSLDDELKNDATKVNRALNTVAYCHENTFDIANMKEKQTTRIIAEATYMPTNPVTDGTEVWDSETPSTWYKVGSGNVAYTPEGLKKVLAAAIDPADATALDSFIAATDAGVADVTFTTSGKKASDIVGTIYRYTNGVCYYPIRIRHFTDIELGYASAAEFESSFLTGYKSKDLGRYGVVRNNWYQISVNSVSSPGEPTIPEAGEDLDDKTKAYLSCNINILAWCLRTHSVDL